MKSIKKIVKWLFTGFLIIILLGVLVFVVAGLMPVKDQAGAINRSCYVAMKDGTRLAVRYSLPAELKAGERIPAVIETTRYVTENQRSLILKAILNLKIAKEVSDGIKEAFINSKYAFVRVDARGSGSSFGAMTMEFSREQINDMGQVIDWIASQPWSNGKVGSFGISYSGNTAELAAVTKHPALQAAALINSDFDVFSQSVAPGGIPNDYLVTNWYDEIARMDSNNTKNLFFRGTAPVDGDRGKKLLKQAINEHKTINISDALKNVTYADDILTEGYTADSMSPYKYRKEIEQSKVPYYVRVGWMDAGTVNGAIERFLTYSNAQTLVIGPWSHAGRYFYDPFLTSSENSKQLLSAQMQDVTDFFDGYLKTEANTLPGMGNLIRYYTFGEGKWKTTDTWPVKGFDKRTLYFSQNNSLKETKPVDAEGADVYKVDLTATTGNSNRWMTNLGGGEIFYPNRAEEDKKLLTYTSDALAYDTEITGVPAVTLNLSSNVDDGAFFTYLEDVAPDGKVTYITEGELRALHRKTANSDLGHTVLDPAHSYKKADGELLKPGENAELKISMYATSVLIKKGHKIRVTIAGADTSNFSRIPEIGEPVINVQRNSILSSFIELPMRENRD